MSENYGPLQGLIGSWKGEKGIDVAPEPDDTERNPYWETIEFEGIGDVENAQKQILMVVQYRQRVYRQSNNKQFHDQVGYITWHEETGEIAHSFVIPRGVGVVAMGSATEEGGKVTIKVDVDAAAAAEGICQSPFMKENARTVSFTQTMVLEGDNLSYEERTLLDIYGREFDHVDKSKLVRQ